MRFVSEREAEKPSQSVPVVTQREAEKGKAIAHSPGDSRTSGSATHSSLRSQRASSKGERKAETTQ